MTPSSPAETREQEREQASDRSTGKPMPRKRKSTYRVRKEESKALRGELESLQREVAVLRARERQRTPSVQQHQLWQALSTNGVLQDAIHGQQLVVANAQSMLTQLQEQHPNNPLHTHIHLPEAWDERRAALLQLKGLKFSRGCEYVMARSQRLDLMSPHSSDHRYQDPLGHFCCEKFEIIHFTGVHSLRQVFDAVKFFVTNMEISISERLGHTTVREDYDSVDEAASLSNYRLVSGDGNGVTTEMNTVTFSEYFERHEQLSGRACAVHVTDSVDVDDLYPYSPSDRVRKDVSAAIILTETTRKRPKSDGNRAQEDEEAEEELVVVMQRSEFPVSGPALNALQEGISRWGDVMLHTIRGVLDTVLIESVEQAQEEG
ncbi:hypothetical protein BBJ28_00003217 [Nothophytophthora sp. Chile5]|nr:hypothetical protein BBJ28_00003217 [Nothophytophthora sp. Chile5]